MPTQGGQDRAPRLGRLACTLALALTAAVTAAGPATAAGSSLAAEGLHISTGALVDPAGRTWVSDHNGGFCRVTAPTDAGPGRIEHPTRPGTTQRRTCLGGLLPDAAPGPDAAGQPALFDPTPDVPGSGDEVALIPDGASPSSEVVRAIWNPDSRLFEFRDTISLIGDRVRPVAVGLGPDGDAYVTFQRSGTIQRISDLAAAVPVVDVVGRTSDGRGAGAVAAGRDALGAPTVYVGEAGGLRELAPSAVAPPTTRPSFALPAASDGTEGAIGALAYDTARDLLLAGTANAVALAAAGTDVLHRIDVRGGGAVEAAFASGFSMVGGVAVRPDGHVLVLDDPALLDPAEPLGTGRMFHVGLPVAHVLRGPLDDDGVEAADRGFTQDRTPGFELAGDGELECRLTGPGTDGGWAACADGTFAVADALDDGAYALAVRARDGETVGITEVHRFSVDTVAPPAPVVVRPGAGATVSGRPWFELRSEPGASLSCRFDDEAEATPCTTGRLRTWEAEGTHTLTVVATDRAGNVSAESDPHTFSVDPTLPAALAVPWGPGPMTHRGASLYAGGLHISTGAVVDPAGRVWVTDHNGGFCRVTDPTDDGPGRIEHPDEPGGAGPRTCLGGLLPDAGPGPDAAGQPALVDPTPFAHGSGDETVLIPDGASPSSEVVRARWNPDTALFEHLDAVTMVNDGRGVRPTAASLGPDGAVYVVFQRSDTIQRIADPAGEDPVAQVVGRTADGNGTAAVAAGRALDTSRTVVYVGESTGLRVLEPTAVAPPATRPSFALPGGAAPGISTLLYDLERDHLWVGTAQGAAPEDAGRDVLHRLEPLIAGGALQAAYAGGFTMVGGLGLRPDGVVYVLDDPALLDPDEPLGTGRLFHVGLPAAHVARGPLGDDDAEATDRAFTADPTPAFAVVGEGVVDCALRPAGQPAAWAPCPEDGRVMPVEPLADGAYVLSVRSRDGEVTGLPEAHAFTVDTVAPARPAILSPSAGLVGPSPWFAFDAEPSASFLCRWDGTGGFAPCSPGRTRTFPTLGDHALEIKAVDRAGNVSAASEPVAFRTAGVLTRVTITGGPAARTADASPTFTFTAGEVAGVTYTCRLAGQAFAPCASPATLAALSEGAHTFEVRARDLSGNVTAIARRAFTVDRTGPRTRVEAPEEGAVTAADVTAIITADEASTTWTCRLDGVALATCGARTALSGLAPGAHVLEVTGTDDLGNRGPTATRRFAVAAPAPVVPPPGGPASAAPTPAPPAAPAAAASAAELAVRLLDADRRVAVTELRAAGLQLTVRPAAEVERVRFRVLRDGRGRGRAAATTDLRALVAEAVRRVRGARRMNVTIGSAVRRLAPGRYVLEIAGRDATGRWGATTRHRFEVGR